MNHVLDGVQIPMRMDNFDGKGAAHCKVYGLAVANCAKTTQPVEMPFGVCIFRTTKIEQLFKGFTVSSVDNKYYFVGVGSS